MITSFNRFSYSYRLVYKISCLDSVGPPEIGVWIGKTVRTFLGPVDPCITATIRHFVSRILTVYTKQLSQNDYHFSK